jgi:hypothetical protein
MDLTLRCLFVHPGLPWVTKSRQCRDWEWQLANQEFHGIQCMSVRIFEHIEYILTAFDVFCSSNFLHNQNRREISAWLNNLEISTFGPSRGVLGHHSTQAQVLI